MNEIFESIALTFSGGGYRASCFSLGSLSFLEKIGLLKNVKAISTVSGGTITGVKYTESQISDKSFDTFFQEYYLWLEEDKLAENAISNLKGFKVWNRPENKHKRENPINAFAIEYNKFTNQKTIGDIQEIINEGGKTHLERVIFNATDFTNGVEFRFQNIDKSGRRLGNSKVPNINSLVGKIKLGDALAASSAFPGGFEPISFPSDYFESKDSKLEEIGLMDGGVIDNQGISSLLTSDNDKSLYKFYLINDVASPDISEPFEFSSENTFIKVLSYLSSIPSLIFLLVLTIIFFILNWQLFYSVTIIATSLMIGVQLVLLYAARKIKNETGIQESLVIPSRKFGFFVMDRINSLIKMSNDVFLKSARRRNYNILYEGLRNRSATNAIYELRCKNGKPENASHWDDIKVHTGDIPPIMKTISEQSAAFGTTLWFSDADKKDKILDKLIACGEYTACYNILSFLITEHPEKIKDGGEAHYFFNQILTLWVEFKENPYFLLEERKSGVSKPIVKQPKNIDENIKKYKLNNFLYVADYNKINKAVSIIHDQTKPEHIFKFYTVSSNSVDALVKGYFYASHPFELNDILDSSPFLMFASKKLDFEFYERFLGESYKNDRQGLLDFYKEDCSNTEMCKGYISTMWDVSSNLFGIISTTTKEDNTLMWPHYTQEKGFQIKFKTDLLEKSIENKVKSNEEYLGLFPINYVDKLQPIDVSEFHNFLIPMYYATNVKLKDWKYEQEWRFMVGKPNMGVPYSKSGFDPREDYLLNIKNRYTFYDKNLVEEITLGWQFFNGREFDMERIDNEKIKVKPKQANSNWEYESQIKLLTYIVENLKDKLFCSGIKYEIDEDGKNYLIRTKERMEIDKIEDGYFLLTRTNSVIKFL